MCLLYYYLLMQVKILLNTLLLQVMSLWNSIMGMIKGEKTLMYFNSKLTIISSNYSTIFMFLFFCVEIMYSLICNRRNMRWNIWSDSHLFNDSIDREENQDGESNAGTWGQRRVLHTKWSNLIREVNLLQTR